MIDARLVTADDLDALKAEITADLVERLRPKWLNEKDAADYLGIPAKSLGNARRDGKVSAHRPTGGTYLYAREELDRFTREG